MVKFLSYALVFAIGIIVGLIIEEDGTVNNYFKNRRGVQNIENKIVTGKRRKIKLLKRNKDK